MRRRAAHCVTIEEVPEVEEQQPGSLENPLETEEFRAAWAQQAAATDWEEALEKAIQEETLYQDPDEGAVVDQALKYPQENHPSAPASGYTYIPPPAPTPKEAKRKRERDAETFIAPNKYATEHAYQDIKNILTPPCKKGPGHLDAKLNPLLQTRLEAMKRTMWRYIDSKGALTWIKASEQVALDEE